MSEQTLSRSALPSAVASKPKSSFRPDIEGLRGIAVLLVVLFHVGIPGVRGGFVGVDVFFALSGYLITGLLVREVETSGRLNIHEFYARRVRRLLPASALVLLVCLLAGYLLLAPEELSFLARAARGTALYMSNIFFMRNAGDYFAPGAETNPLLHTWSLAVEEQFYLVWPWLIMLALWRSRSRTRLVAVMLLITAVSLAGCVWLTDHLRTWAFYGSWSRAWEFGLGGLAAMLPVTSRKGWHALGWAGIGLVLASGLFIQEDMAFPGAIAVFPVMGTIWALIAGAANPDSALNKFLGIRPLQFLGKMSYSWYLWHWPALVFAAAVMPWISWPGRLLWACGALVIATIAYKWIESPVRFHPRLKPRPGLSLGLAAVLTAVCFGSAVAAIRVATHKAAEPVLQSITATAEDHATYPPAECFTTGLDPAVRPCQFAKLDSLSSLAIFGDSHAAVWFGPTREIAERRGWKLTTFLKSGCPATSVFLIHPTLGRAAGVACSEWRAEAIRQLVAMRPTLVLIANATSPYLQNGERSASGTRVSLDGWREGTRTTLKALTDAGAHLIQMRDNPSASFDIPTCLARAALHSWYPQSACELSRDTALPPAIFRAEQDAAEGIPDVRFIDLSGQFCQGQTCPTKKDGLILYQDSNHISGGFARQLTPLLEGQLMAAMQAGLSTH